MTRSRGCRNRSKPLGPPLAIDCLIPVVVGTPPHMVNDGEYPRQTAIPTYAETYLKPVICRICHVSLEFLILGDNPLSGPFLASTLLTHPSDDRGWRSDLMCDRMRQVVGEQEENRAL